MADENHEQYNGQPGSLPETELERLVPGELESAFSLLNNLLNAAEAALHLQASPDTGWGESPDEAADPRQQKLQHRIDDLRARLNPEAQMTAADRLAVLLETGQDEDAQALIASVKEADERVPLLLQAADHFLGKEDAETAADITGRIKKSAQNQLPQNGARVYTSLGALQARHGQTEEALASLDKARASSRDLIGLKGGLKKLGLHSEDGALQLGAEQLIIISGALEGLGKHDLADEVLEEARDAAANIGANFEGGIHPDDRASAAQGKLHARQKLLTDIALAYVNRGNLKEALGSVSDISADPGERQEAKETVIRAIVANPSIDPNMKTTVVTGFLSPEDEAYMTLAEQIDVQQAEQAALPASARHELDTPEARPIAGGIVAVGQAVEKVHGSLIPKTVEGRTALTSMIADHGARALRYVDLAAEQLMAGSTEEGIKLIDEAARDGGKALKRRASGHTRLMIPTLQAAERLRTTLTVEVLRSMSEAGQAQQALDLLDTIGIDDEIIEIEGNQPVNPIKELALGFQADGNLDVALQLLKKKEAYTPLHYSLMAVAENANEVTAIASAALEAAEGQHVSVGAPIRTGVRTTAVNRLLELGEPEAALQYRGDLSPFIAKLNDGKTLGGYEQKEYDGILYSFNRITRAFIANGQIDRALDMLEGRVEGVKFTHEDTIDLKQELGNALLEQDKPEEAYVHLRAAWDAANPHDKSTYDRGVLVRSLAKTGHHAEVLADIKDGLFEEGEFMGKKDSRWDIPRASTEDKPKLIAELSRGLKDVSKFDEALEVVDEIEDDELKAEASLSIAKSLIASGATLQDERLVKSLQSANVTDPVDVVALVVDVTESMVRNIEHAKRTAEQAAQQETES